jgi:Sugar (and other) transporter
MNMCKDAPTIFMSAGFTSVSNSLFLTGLFGVVKVLSALSFMLIFVDWFGNRFWLRFGSAICGLSMLVLTISVRQMSTPNREIPGDGSLVETSITLNGLVSVTMVYVFAFAFGTSLGPLSWNICSEIFPAHLRTTCCTITTITQWVFQIVISAITPNLLASIGWATYLLYAICCAVSFLWVSWYVPETKDVPMGREMDKLFGSTTTYEWNAETIEETNETTSLLASRTRRSSSRRESIGLSV